MNLFPGDAAIFFPSIAYSIDSDLSIIILWLKLSSRGKAVFLFFQLNKVI